MERNQIVDALMDLLAVQANHPVAMSFPSTEVLGQMLLRIDQKRADWPYHEELLNCLSVLHAELMVRSAAA